MTGQSLLLKFSREELIEGKGGLTLTETSGSLNIVKPTASPERPPSVQSCGRCGYSYSVRRAPLGQCPRCLLLAGDEDMETEPEPAPLAASPPQPGVATTEEWVNELPDYEVMECLGRGGMGSVWKAREKRLDRMVAIKLLNPSDEQKDFTERFLREARIMARLNHPNIVTLYSFGRTVSGRCYLVMELVDGTNSITRMEKDTKVPVPEALRIIKEICDALQHAHDCGVVHRDIKPGNILVDRQGRIKVADFGLAQIAAHLDPSTLRITKQGWVVGTPNYVAPEQERAKSIVDHRADIYSLGVLFYQMLTGELPRGVFAPPSRKIETNWRMDRIVLRTLNEKPSKRYPSARELKADIEAWERAADPFRAAEEAARKRSRARQHLETALAAMAAMLVGIIAAWTGRGWFYSGSGDRAPQPAGFLDQPTADNAPAIPLGPDAQLGIRDGIVLPQEAGLKIAREIRLQPAFLDPEAHYGKVLAGWQDWLAVSARYEGRAHGHSLGSIYLYHRGPGHQWQFAQRIDNPNPDAEGLFAYSMAMDAGRLAIGTPGVSRKSAGRLDIYELGMRDKWIPSSAPCPMPEDRTHTFGNAVALSGGTLAVSDTAREPGGAIYSLQWSVEQKKWLSQTTFTDPSLHAGAGCALALMSGAILAGRKDWGHPDADLDASALVTLKPELPHPWSSESAWIPVDFAGTRGFDVKVTASSNLVVVGGPSAYHHAGAAWILHPSDHDHLDELCQLRAPASMGQCELGRSVALQGDWVALGAPNFTINSQCHGAVCLYHHSTSKNHSTDDWRLALRINADSPSGANEYGDAILLTPHYLAVGAPSSHAVRVSDENQQGPGAVYVYDFEGELK